MLKEIVMLDVLTVVELMASYFIICGVLTWKFSNGTTKTKENFLLANRSFNTLKGMFSISAAWIWATGLFVVPQLCYQYGFTGFFWILGMNTLTLGIFGFAAVKVRELYPNGFTFAEHIKNTYGRAAHNTYIFAFFIISLLAFGVNIYAGSKLIQTIAGLNMNIAAAFIIVSAITFSLFRGLRGTVVTEIFKMATILATAVIVAPLVWNIVGWDTIVKGVTGISGNYGGLWSNSEEITMFLTIGIFFVFRHLSLPWADNSFWQRAFVVDPTKIKRTFAGAAAIFFIGPALFATLGFAAAGLGLKIDNVQLTNVIVVEQLLSPWALYMLVFMLLTGLTSLLDSQITSMTTLFSHDVVPQFNKNTTETQVIDYSRLGVIIMILLSWGLVNIPGVNIVWFSIVGGSVCMSFFVPTIIALFRPQWLEAKSLVASILLALFVGVPVFGYASLNKLTDLALIGFFSSLFISSIVCLGGGYIANRNMRD
jgi:SSS family solute:Na+ symporter